jgi:hypothetical protein
MRLDHRDEAVELAVVEDEARVDRRRFGDEAGPPPLAIDWRTSTGINRRIGPLPATISSNQAQTSATSCASVGRISAMPPCGSVTSWALNR